MKTLIISPVIFPVRPNQKYAGIERLCLLWARELSKTSQVSVVSASGSCLPKEIEHIEVPLGDFTQGELVAYGIYAHRLREYDLVLDFSHSHWASRQQNIPSISWVWHDPGMMQPPLPSYNVAALSYWQQIRLWSFQNTRARVVDCHCGQASQEPLPENRLENFIFVGKIGPLKGALEAVKICKDLNFSLIIIGQPGPGDSVEYARSVKAKCDSGRLWLDVSDEIKNWLVSRARALIYPLSYPGGCGEAHSHKLVDCLLLGCPVVTYDVGANREIVEHKVDGFLAKDEEEFKAYMGRVDELDRQTIKERAIERWSVEKVVERHFPLLREVAGGLRW